MRSSFWPRPKFLKSLQRYYHDASGNAVAASWTAGGSPIPNGAVSFSLSGNENVVTIIWESPAANTDGTPMDDYAGINLYQNGVFLETIARTAADTGRADTADYTVPAPGFYDWHITIVDNEVPPNESEPTLPLGTPLALPFLGASAAVAGTVPAMLCGNCGFGSNKENCVKCGNWVGSEVIYALLCDNCGFGNNKENCAKCGEWIGSEKTRARLCGNCGFASNKEKCIKCGN